MQQCYISLSGQDTFLQWSSNIKNLIMNGEQIDNGEGMEIKMLDL